MEPHHQLPFAVASRTPGFIGWRMEEVTEILLEGYAILGNDLYGRGGLETEGLHINIYI